jgi:hypothetical protein
LGIAAIGLGLLTSASFYVSFLMPDIFAGIAVLACASLLGSQNLKCSDYVVWAGLLLFALVAHTSHVLIAALLAVVAVVINVFGRSWRNWRGLLVVAGCLLAAGVAEAAFKGAVMRLIGEPPLRPPFLMARLIEDGSGYRFLRESCPGNGFKVCEFLPQLPMLADEFLWSAGARGVFATASPQVRRELAAEQFRFVAAVVRSDPKGVLLSSCRDALLQLEEMRLSDFNWFRPWADAVEAKLPADYRAAFRASASYRNVMPIAAAYVLQLAVFFVALGVLIAAVARSRWRRQLARDRLLMVALVAIGFLSNDLICGVLSGPHDRYGARVSWLLPFVALAVCFALRGEGPRLTRSDLEN